MAGVIWPGRLNLQMKNFFLSVRNAFNGIGYAFSSERNLRIQLLIFVLVVLAGFVLQITKIEFVFTTVSVESVKGNKLVLIDLIGNQYAESIGLAD